MNLVGVIDDAQEFFAPVASDMLDGLIGQYRAMRQRVEQVAETVTGETAGAIGYFLTGNGSDRHRSMPSVERLFEVNGAIASLNAAYWSKTLALTDVLDMMPQARRDEWNKSITEMTTPDYTEEAVRPTIESLLAMRAQFLAERVDGIFRGLSGEHVTNSPMAFGKRMIIGYMLSDYGGVSYQRAGLVNDLRAVIAKFMGRDEPNYSSSSRLIETLKSNWGQWTTIDGGAIRIRLYKKGTAHMEIHPDMAWRLNSVLAHLYPMAIPAENRAKPKKRVKEFQMMQRPLPFAVLGILADCRPRREATRVSLAGSWEKNRFAQAEAGRVLRGIGGAETSPNTFDFDYPPGAVLDEIITSGCIPDQKTHQFYPTPENVAQAAIELAQIGENDYCLEPSAGQGGLADMMPKDRTTCVELSGLHCRILEAKGYRNVCNDFLNVDDLIHYDRIVMNPPFADGRSVAHIEAASRLLNIDGRLVAILPASMKGKPVNFAGKWTYEWTQVYDNEFAGTSVAVVILCAVRLA